MRPSEEAQQPGVRLRAERAIATLVQRPVPIYTLLLVVALAFMTGVVSDRSFLNLQAQSQRTILMYLGAAALMLLATVPWVVGAMRKSLDILELVYPFSFFYFVTFGARMIWILRHPQALQEQTPHPSVIYLGLLPAIVVAAAGLGAYLAGYYLLGLWRRRQSAVAQSERDPQALAVLALAIFGAGLAFRAPLLLGGWFMGFAAGRFEGQVPALVHSLAYLGVLGSIGYVLAFAAYFSPGRPAWLAPALWLGIVPLETLYTFLIGSKFFFLVLLVMPIAAYHYLRRRVGLVTLVGVLMFFLLVVTPLVSVYRSVADYGDLTIRNFPTAFPSLLDRVASRLFSLSWREYFDASLGVANARFAGIDSLAAVIRGIPVITDFQQGRSLSWSMKILVPTFVWPDKYNELVQDLTPVPLLFGFEDFSRGGLSITMPGELYWNFGLFGVVVGMAAVGIFQRLIVATLRRPEDLLRICLYALVWTWIVLSFEGWSFAQYPNVIRMLILGAGVLWGGTFLATRMRRRRGRPDRYVHAETPTPH